MTKMETRIELSDNEAKLRQLLLDAAKYIGTLEGHRTPQLRFTGGWVRDKLLGIQSHDIDVGIDNMTGSSFSDLLVQYLELPEVKIFHKDATIKGLGKIAANPEKSKHLETITTKILGLDIDLVNLRKETYADNSRTPTMEFGTPEEDAKRRDSTVNALFYNLESSEVEDFTQRGLEDMEQGIIKTPLDATQTFKDDPLRVLRCIRFASRLKYSIDENDQTAMKEESIKDALKLKISRERVGEEITKMLKGTNPVAALVHIHELDLYNVVFTNPNKPEQQAKTNNWARAYKLLEALASNQTSTADNAPMLEILREILLRNTQDTFQAWLLACFVPWARETMSAKPQNSGKRVLSPAGLAAKEGLKVENKMINLVDDAVIHLPDAISMRKAVHAERTPLDPPSKRKATSLGRDVQGQLVRKWGSEWRNIVVFALLVEIADCDVETERLEIQLQYAAWMTSLKTLDLLNVDKLTPVIKGNQIQEALGIKSGPWMRKAMDLAMDWQLRNPDIQDPSDGIAEVVSRKKEYFPSEGGSASTTRPT